MKVSRTYARIVLLTGWIFLFLIVYGSITDNQLLHNIGMFIASIGFLIHYLKIKCPNCGNKLIPIHWFKGGIDKCRKCGKFIEFDR